MRVKDLVNRINELKLLQNNYWADFIFPDDIRDVLSEAEIVGKFLYEEIVEGYETSVMLYKVKNDIIGIRYITDPYYEIMEFKDFSWYITAFEVNSHALLVFEEEQFSAFTHIDDKSVDLILADLPYGETANKMDKRLPFDKLWEQYLRVIKDDGAILLFAQGLFYVDLVNSQRRLFRYDLIWDKVLTTGFLNAKRMPLRSHEQIAVFYKKLPIYNPQFTIGKPLHSKGVNYKKAELVNNNYGNFTATDDSRAGSTQKYPKSIWKFPKPHPSVAKHRTQKPVELLEELILTYSNEGEVVLDNVMGSGSTGVAALNTGRKFIGFENDSLYFENSIKWLQEEHPNKIIINK